MGCSQYHNGLNKIDLNKTSELALENKPEILSNNRDIQAGQSLSNTAFELPKTGVNFQYGNTDGFEYNDGLRISQNIPFPTLFGARKNLVSEQMKGRKWANSLTETELEKKVRAYYSQFKYLQNNATVFTKIKRIHPDIT